MKKTLIALFIVLTSLASAQTQLTLPQLNAIWNTPSVPKGLNNTNTWYSLLQTLSINSTSLTISGGNSVNLSFITSGASITGTLSVGSVPYAVGTRTLTNGPLYTDGTNVGLGTTTLTSTFNLNGSLMYVDGNQGAGKILVSDANGVGAWTTNSVTSGGSSVYNGTNTVGYMPYVKARNAAGTSYTLAPSPWYTDGSTNALYTTSLAISLDIEHGMCYDSTGTNPATFNYNRSQLIGSTGSEVVNWYQGLTYDLSHRQTASFLDGILFNPSNLANTYIWPENLFFKNDGSGDTAIYVNEHKLVGGAWYTSTLGIGTTTTSATLQVNGSLRFITGGEGAGKILVSDAFGFATWTTNTVTSSTTFTIALTGAGINTVTQSAGNSYTITGTEAQTLSLNSANALMISGTSSTVQITTGYAYVGVPSSAMVGKVIAGASGYVESYTTNANVFEGYAFVTTATTSVQFLWQAPDGWDMGTVKFKFSWTTISTTVTGTAGVAWEVSGVAIGDAAALDVSTGTKVIITDTNNGKDQNNITSATAAVTISGTPAIGKFVLFTVTRQINDAADNLTADAKLLSAQIQYLQANTPTTIW